MEEQLYTKGKLYSVNDISSICNLSRRQLRYYEERGLITNVVRDSKNNYRYYTEEHVATLSVIKGLREIGFPLEAIKELLENNNLSTFKKTIRQGMANAREELSRSVTKYEQSTEKLSQLLEAVFILENKYGNSAQPFKKENCELVNYPAKDVVYISGQGNFWEDTLNFYKQGAKLEQIIEEYGLTKIAPRISLFDGHFDAVNGGFINGDHHIEFMYEIKERHSNCPHCKHIPGFRAVSANHVGDYDKNLRDIYDAMFAWSREHGLKLANVSYEESLMDLGFSHNHDFWVSRILIPVLEEE